MRALSTYCETQKTMNIRNIYGILLYYNEKTRSALATHKSRYFSYPRLGTSVYYLFTVYGQMFVLKDMEECLPRTQTSLSRWNFSSKGRREGENGLHLASCSFPCSIALRHQFTLVSRLKRRQVKYFLCRCIKLFLKTWFYCHFLLRLT